jgi:hypothetical protein
LLRAARLHILMGEAPLAKKLLEKALAAPDLSRTTLDHPFYVRQGESYVLVMALAENGSGDRRAAERQLDVLLAALDRMKQAGMERYGVYTLRADVLAMRGDADGAMAALGRAAELGWRGAIQALHDPALASLQARADFKALLERLREQDQRMGANYSTH